MTIVREPDTFEWAIFHIADRVGGLAALADKLGLSEGTVTRWSNPNDRLYPNPYQALALDTVYRNHVGAGAPMQEMHEALLDRAVGASSACRRIIVALLSEFVTENADALAALLPLTQPGVERHQILRARREIGQARGALGQLACAVDQILSTGGQMPGGAQ